MAVCGRCWICGDKFSCNELKSCGCIGKGPINTEHGNVPGRERHQICVECEQDIDSGAVGDLISALRARTKR